MKMKAAVMRAPFEPVTIEEVDIGEPGPREILIKTGASGVCHSDLHYVDGLYKHNLPTILGHEAAGTVEKVGSLVTYHQPGDRVITCLSVFCGTCDKCIRGEMVNCRGIGLKRAPSEPPRLHKGDEVIHQAMSLSSFAEYMLVHENAAVVVEEDVPIEVQALIGCGVTTGVGAAMRTARVIPGSTVAVVGCGGVGLSAINGAIIAGAARVIAIDAVEDKLGFAQRVGATDVIDASKGGVVEKVKKLTGGQRSGLLLRSDREGRDGGTVLRHARCRGHGHDNRDDPAGDEDYDRRPIHAGRAPNPGKQHGIQSLPCGHAAVHGAVPAGTAEAG